MPVFQLPFLQNSAQLFEGIQTVNARLCRSCIGYADNNTKEAEHTVGSKCSLFVVFWTRPRGLKEIHVFVGGKGSSKAYEALT